MEPEPTPGLPPWRVPRRPLFRRRGGSRNIPLHLGLFLLTALTTVAAGALLDGADIIAHPRLLYRGIPFASSLLLILGVHETAHFLASRRHGIAVTLPFFIPAPTLIGTMGAVIKIKSPITDRRALLDIGASGPLAGFAVSLPLAAAGLSLSTLQEIPEGGEGMLNLGSSLLFELLVRLFAPAETGDLSLVLHPVAFAAWVGMLVTSLNLLPIGQLDGGHIVCALLGPDHRAVSLAFLVLLVPLGFYWQGWLVWAALLVIIGWRHPEPLDIRTPLDSRRRLAGILALAVFILTFTPAPFVIP